MRQRSLVPVGAGGVLEGWMDDDAASAAGQLFGQEGGGVLVIDSRELLTSTARVVGAVLGDLHFKAWMALITLHVVQGMPEHGRATTTLGELGRLVWGTSKQPSGHEQRREFPHKAAWIDRYAGTLILRACPLG